MVQGRGCARFLGEALQAFGIGGERCGQNLDGDVAAEAGVAGTVDFAHASRAYGSLNFVGAEFGARSQGHGCGNYRRCRMVWGEDSRLVPMIVRSKIKGPTLSQRTRQGWGTPSRSPDVVSRICGAMAYCLS